MKDFKKHIENKKKQEENKEYIVLEDYERRVKEQEARDKARERHLSSDVKPYKVPLLWIRDKNNGEEHLYGTDIHDSLWIDGDGNLQYENLQNSCGTGGKDATYEFVDHSDEYGYGSVLEYHLESNDIR